ncbi:MAG: 50S ribosomal protein L23 [Mycoplasmataceae bacterium]|jgi:large subunit ribosomal protein L23|nr:50S ribosomal protein L23 [Mycoplasmataceae bacterium]
MEFTKIIIKPYNTEKSYKMQSLLTPKYAFVVDPKANKYDINIAFQSIYGYKPVSITTQLKKPASIRTGTAKPGVSKLTKIAYVTLAKGVKLAPNEEEQGKGQEVIAESITSSAKIGSAEPAVIKKEKQVKSKKTSTK